MTNKERKLQTRSRYKVILPSQEKKPYTQRFAEQVKNFHLSRLGREVKKNTRLRRELVSEFKEWSETTGLTYEVWPDLFTYLKAKSMAKILLTEIMSRKIPVVFSDSFVSGLFDEDQIIFVKPAEKSIA